MEPCRAAPKSSYCFQVLLGVSGWAGILGLGGRAKWGWGGHEDETLPLGQHSVFKQSSSLEPSSLAWVNSVAAVRTGPYCSC